MPSGPINTAADICSDEQYAARNMIQQFTVDTGEAEPKQVGFPPGIVPVIGGKSLPIRSVGPDLGEHTREVLGTLLGKTPEQIDSIVNDTVGGSHDAVFESRALLRDVTLRDGLQLTGKMLSTARKLEIARRLLELGVPALEIGRWPVPTSSRRWRTPSR